MALFGPERYFTVDYFQSRDVYFRTSDCLGEAPQFKEDGLIERSVIHGMGVFLQCSEEDHWIRF